MGDIYLLESPSEANSNKNFFRLLYKAIRKYKPENFKIYLICSCSIEEMNDKEAYIQEYNTLTPNGYNLMARSGKGSHQSEETIRLKSISLKGKNLGRIIDIKKERKNPEDNNLPKYLRKIKDGYRISNHPSK